MTLQLDSSSTGDPARHLALPELERLFGALASPPRDAGSVGLIVRRGQNGVREVLEGASLISDSGLAGDAWGRRPDRDLHAQLTAVRLDVAHVIANGQPLALFGDQLFLHLDLSRANLPVGSRVRVGQAIVDVSPKPHNGCQKYRSRFGDDAFRFVCRQDLRPMCLRGVYFRVLTDGHVSVGDPVRVMTRS